MIGGSEEIIVEELKGDGDGASHITAAEVAMAVIAERRAAETATPPVAAMLLVGAVARLRRVDGHSGWLRG